jgi:hypothetical protein
MTMESGNRCDTQLHSTTISVAVQQTEGEGASRRSPHLAQRIIAFLLYDICADPREFVRLRFTPWFCGESARSDDCPSKSRQAILQK